MTMKRIRGIALIGLLLIANLRATGNAEEATETPEASTHVLRGVMLFEGLSLFNSTLAGFLPRTTGAIELVTLPLAIADAGSNHPYTSAVAATGYGGLGIYNVLGPNKEGQFKWETFGVNMAVWHVTGLLTWYAEYLQNKKEVSKDDEQKVSLSINSNLSSTIVSARAKF